AVLDQGGVACLPGLGDGRDRHDEHAGGEARARGGALLRDAGARDRLRRVARDARGGLRRGRGPEPPEERRDGEGSPPRRDPDARAAPHVRVRAPPRERGDHEFQGIPAEDPDAARAPARPLLPRDGTPAWLTSSAARPPTSLTPRASSPRSGSSRQWARTFRRRTAGSSRTAAWTSAASRRRRGGPSAGWGSTATT